MGKASRKKKEARLREVASPKNPIEQSEQPKRRFVVKLRELIMPPSGTVDYTVPAVCGGTISFSARPLSFENQKKVLWALDYIGAHYIPQVFGIPLTDILRVASRTCFFQTESADVAAYKATLSGSGEPVVIFSLKILDLRNDDERKREFVETVLHELLHHLVTSPEHKSYLSKWEVLHDVRCYAALGMQVPAKHLANRIPPEKLNN